MDCRAANGLRVGLLRLGLLPSEHRNGMRQANHYAWRYYYLNYRKADGLRAARVLPREAKQALFLSVNDNILVGHPANYRLGHRQSDSGVLVSHAFYSGPRVRYVSI